MSTQQRDNSGVIFKNDRRTKDTHPEYNGNCTIGGKEFWISCWVKEGQRGKFFSLAFKPKEPFRAQQSPTAPTNGSLPPSDDSDVPF